MDRSALAKFYDDDGAPRKPRPAAIRLLFNAAHLYRLRVREQPLQEVLALFGIAAGVALLFAVQVASTSVTGSLAQLAEGVTGRASLEIAARGPGGMDQDIVAKVQKLASVHGAAPLIEQRITVVGPAGSAPLTLVGVDERLEKIGGSLVRSFTAQRNDLNALGFYLTSATARAIGASTGEALTIESGGRAQEVILAGTLGPDDIGGLAESPVALAPLGQAQRIAEMPGRISRVLVEPKPGSDTAADLRAMAGEKFNVRASDTEVDLLTEALKPDKQSSALFSAIAVVIGLLFAYNAMLLAIARRRRLIAYLRMIGADRATVLAMLVFEALVLGVVASLVGIGLGDLLSRVAFQSIPEYLTAGFTIGAQRIIEAKVVALSVVGGLAAALLASAKPALDLFRVDPAEAAHERIPIGGEGEAVLNSKTFWFGLAVIVVSSVLLFLWPVITPVGVAALIGGLVLILGPLLFAILKIVSRATRVRGGIGFALAVDELAGTPARATALAVIVACAMMATLSIGGARQDLERGLDRYSNEYYESSQIWITRSGKANAFLTQQFNPRPALKRLNEQAGIRDVSVHYATFLDIGRRRLYVVARPRSDPLPIAPSQIVSGNVKAATERIRAGGWVALSESFANEHEIKLGDKVVIPLPSGRRPFHVAALIANYGWPTGGVVMNADDYAKSWGNRMASAIAVRLKPNVALFDGQRRVARTIGFDGELRVQTADAIIKQRIQERGQGLARLRQISTLVLVAAMLAIVAAMFAAVWQRRTRLASMRAIGLYRTELYRTLFSEIIVIVLFGGLAGLAYGLYCQYFASRWNEVMSGYQAPYEPAIGLGLVTLAQSLLLAVIATAGPAYLASRIAPRASGDE